MFFQTRQEKGILKFKEAKERHSFDFWKSWMKNRNGDQGLLYREKLKL